MILIVLILRLCQWHRFMTWGWSCLDKGNKRSAFDGVKSYINHSSILGPSGFVIRWT